VTNPTNRSPPLDTEKGAECDRCQKRYATSISVELNESWCDGCVDCAGARGGRWRDLEDAELARKMNRGLDRKEEGRR